MPEGLRGITLPGTTGEEGPQGQNRQRGQKRPGGAQPDPGERQMMPTAESCPGLRPPTEAFLRLAASADLDTSAGPETQAVSDRGGGAVSDGGAVCVLRVACPSASSSRPWVRPRERRGLKIPCAPLSPVGTSYNPRTWVPALQTLDPHSCLWLLVGSMARADPKVMTQEAPGGEVWRPWPSRTKEACCDLGTSS